MAMLKVWILYCLPFQKASQFATYITVLSVCVHSLRLLKQQTECHGI
jgi:hypothetical protein